MPIYNHPAAGSGTGDLLASNNLSDVDSAATSRTNLGLAIGVDVLAQQTIGIADDNLVETDSALIASGEYAKFTANGLESKTFAEVRSDLNVEDGAEANNISDGDATDLTDGGETNLHYHAGGGGLLTKEITIENPNSSEDISWFYTPVAITVTAVEGVLNNGTTTPTVTVEVKHHTDRSNAGNDVFAAGRAVTSVTTGDNLTLGGDVTIPANSFVWVETTAQGGVVPELFLSMKVTID